jgi:small-conductance mechanosensitive channel
VQSTKDALAHATTAALPANSNANLSSLIAETRGWWALRGKRKQLQAAQQEAYGLEGNLAKSEAALQSQLTSDSAKETQNGAARAQQDASAQLAAMAQLSDEQKTVAQTDKRLETAKDLDATYWKWIELVQGWERAELHSVLLLTSIVLVIGVAMLVAYSYIRSYFARLAPERRRLRTVSSVIEVGVLAAGVLLILLVLFGPPGQLATVLALAGAGLTVVLKDFIVGFLGWFVLMGKNGIQLGDWVEIEGVGGEVIEIGLLRTVLLETGNWNDAGHPTGRRVSFVNSYAVEGHYFNFSTAGQWLWDELEVYIPAGEDPAPIADAMQQLVAAETAKDARVAEEEWKRVTASQGLQSFSAEPAVSVKSTSAGIEISVRYITRANERHELRRRLNQAAIEMLQRRPGSAAVVAAPPAEAAPDGAKAGSVPASGPSAAPAPVTAKK